MEETQPMSLKRGRRNVTVFAALLYLLHLLFIIYLFHFYICRILLYLLLSIYLFYFYIY